MFFDHLPRAYDVVACLPLGLVAEVVLDRIDDAQVLGVDHVGLAKRAHTVMPRIR